MDSNLPSTNLGHIPEMTPECRVYNPKCATDQTQRHGVRKSAGPYTGQSHRLRRTAELGMRVEPVLNTDALHFALHSPWPHPGDDRGM